MIKLFLDVPKCIFMIGVEKEVIEKGIEVRYKSKDQKPISGQDYIEKIIQIPFVLPPIREEEMAAFIENLGIEEQEKRYVMIVAKGAGCNPRKVKMFLNVLRIRHAIVERTCGGINPDLSAKLLVFEYGFPEFYKDVVKYKDQELLCKLERLAIGNYDKRLKEELERSEILKKYQKDEDLKSLLIDSPLFSRINIEPYIHLSGAKSSEEVAAPDGYVLDELLSGDNLEMSRAVYEINKMPDLKKHQFLNVVISKLEEGVVVVRKNAVWALGQIGDPRAVEALEEALKDEDVYVRGGAALALGQIGDAGAVEALKEALKDTDAYVRRNVTWSLAMLRDPRAVEALEEALKDQDEIVRKNAAEALEEIKAK